MSTLNKLVAEVFVIEAAKKMFEKSPDHVVGTQTPLEVQGYAQKQTGRSSDT